MVRTKPVYLVLDLFDKLRTCFLVTILQFYQQFAIAE